MDVQQARNAILAAIPPKYRRTAVAYIVDVPYAERDEFFVDGQARLADRPIFLGFIDLEAGRNWAHPCIYVVISEDQVMKHLGTLPPKVSSPRRLVSLAVGEDVPAWAMGTVNGH